MARFGIILTDAKDTQVRRWVLSTDPNDHDPDVDFRLSPVDRLEFEDLMDSIVETLQDHQMALLEAKACGIIPTQSMANTINRLAQVARDLKGEREEGQ